MLSAKNIYSIVQVAKYCNNSFPLFSFPITDIPVATYNNTRTDTLKIRGLTSNMQLMKTDPAKALGTTADVANAVLFLVSDQASYVTGEVLRVDGGLAM